MQAIIYDIGQKWLVPQKGTDHSPFEEQYIGLRQKEQRIYSDEELVQLPFVQPGNPHHKEWRIRQRSCDRLVNYLKKKKAPQKILEVGCGNGWLCHRLSAIGGSFITGIDINANELRQAARVFAGVPGMQFIYGSLDSSGIMNRYFDTIVFAASIQYFPSLTETINQAMKLLKPGGELHIMDSHFYKKEELAAAAERTSLYYREQGFPGLVGQYFHHCLDELKLFNCRMHYRPSRLAGIFQMNTDPFPWLSIKNNTA